MIELKNITKIFRQKGREVTALSGVSLHIAAGSIFGVIGASGAGKSTLIRCVNLLEHPTSGEVLVNGQNLGSLSKNNLAKARRQIGMIFQHFNLLSSRTVFRNVAFPLELDKMPSDEIKCRVTELLALAGLEDKQNEYPANLSGGQKQRVAIARALASNPKVLLCDEATSALDPATTQSILKLLKDINSRLNITIMLITHEMDVVRTICDEVAVISDGRLIEQGTVSAIFSHPTTVLAQNFISSTIKINLPDDFKSRLSTNPGNGKLPVIKLEFTGESADEPVLSEVTRLFNADHQIICGQIDYVKGIKFGVMIAEVRGTPENIEKALAYYESKHIKAEVLGYV